MAIDKSKRNSLAGTGKKNSYKGMTDAQIKAKRKYDSAYQKKKVAYRVELNKKNRESQRAGKTKVGDKLDMSHTKSGKMVSEKQSKNRGRNQKGATLK